MLSLTSILGAIGPAVNAFLHFLPGSIKDVSLEHVSVDYGYHQPRLEVRFSFWVRRKTLTLKGVSAKVRSRIRGAMADFVLSIVKSGAQQEPPFLCKPDEKHQLVMTFTLREDKVKEIARPLQKVYEEMASSREFRRAPDTFECTGVTWETLMQSPHKDAVDKAYALLNCLATGCHDVDLKMHFLQKRCSVSQKLRFTIDERNKQDIDTLARRATIARCASEPVRFPNERVELCGRC